MYILKVNIKKNISSYQIFVISQSRKKITNIDYNGIQKLLNGIHVGIIVVETWEI